MDEIRAISVLGLKLSYVTVETLHDFIAQKIDRHEKAVVLHLNIHGANLGCRDPELRGIFNQADLIFCDGDGIRWGLRILGEEPPPKITYDRWIWQLAEFCERNGFTLYFLGSQEGVAADAARRLSEKFPALRVLGTQHGYFDKEGADNERVIAEINRLKPDILVVGFGMPAQEKWLFGNWEKIDARIFLSAGAVFEYAAGKAKRAPEWMIRCQLEWLFRLIQEPKRLFGRYVLGNPYFFYQIFLSRLKGRKGRN